MLLRAHARSKPLRVALDEALRYSSFLQRRVVIDLLVDRPTGDVCQVIDDYKGHPDISVHFTDIPLVSAALGERFMETANDQVRRLEEHDCEWIMFADDDRWLEPVGIEKELPLSLADDDVDLIYAHSWFMWDKPNQRNMRRKHLSPIVWRHEHGCRFPPSCDRIIQAPLEIHDEAIIYGRIKTLNTPLLDYGTFDADERARVRKAFVDAGKNDKYIRSFDEEPVLETVTLERDLWSNA